MSDLEASKPQLDGNKGTDGDGFKVPSVVPMRMKKSSSVMVPAELTEAKEGVQTEDRTSIELSPVSSTSYSIPASESLSFSSSSSSSSLSSFSSSSKTVIVEDGGRKVPVTPALPYNEPRWSSKPLASYFLTVIKNGTVVCEVPISRKPYHVFGRLPSCDVQLEHPSISRHHAVLQYRPQDKTRANKGSDQGEDQDENSSLTSHVTISSVSVNPTEEGFYVYDLGSTHGTFINKIKIQTRCYYRLRLGQMVKFGGSSRLFLLETGSSSQKDVEEAALEEIREIVEQKEAMERRKAELESRRILEEKEREDMGAMWGMVTDDIPSSVADEGEDYDIDEDREAYYKEDPKKALKKYFDREGLELEYEVEEEGQPRARVFTVRVRLPMDTATGEAVYAEASVKGKKNAVLQCALNACRMLDVQDLLRPSASGARKAKVKNWAENDYYDSDDDTFLDRTGIIERKRRKRMLKGGVLQEKVNNLETLEADLEQVIADISSINKKLVIDSQVDGSMKEGVDPLEAYMASVGGHLDRGKKLLLKQQLHHLNNEKQRLTKLISLVKPASIPGLKSGVINTSVADDVPDKMEDSPTLIAPATDDEIKSPPGETSSARPSSPNEISRRKALPDDEDQSTFRDSRRRKKKPRLIGPALRPPNMMPKDEISIRDSTGEKSNEEDYADWLPPERQTGDGKTHLNEKFGY